MNSRDFRVKNNTEMVMEFKEKVSTEIATFMRQVTRELDGFTIKTNKAA
jgi:archaellum component FlaC